MKKTLIAVISFIFAVSLFAQSTNGGLSLDKLNLNKEPSEFMNLSSGEINKGLSFQPQANIYKNVLVRQSLLADLNVNTKFDGAKKYIDNPKPKKKSVLLGIVLSALVPGAGEFYSQSYLKAAIFFGVELLSWGAFAYFTIKGDNKTDEFQDFADQNWSVRQYALWLREEWEKSYVNPDDPDLEHLRQTVNQAERELGFTHTLPEYGSQQYYELIGKYQTYVAGWKDARNSSGWIVTKNNYETYKTQMFNDYSFDRQRANDFYNYAKTGIMVVILNHVLSAADAAWTVSVYNKKIKVETGFEIKRYFSPFTGRFGNLPSFNMRVSF